MRRKDDLPGFGGIRKNYVLGRRTKVPQRKKAAKTDAEEHRRKAIGCILASSWPQKMEIPDCYATSLIMLQDGEFKE
jgi:hypothetical protein